MPMFWLVLSYKENVTKHSFAEVTAQSKISFNSNMILSLTRLKTDAEKFSLLR